jgi:hypothetical protein
MPSNRANERQESPIVVKEFDYWKCFAYSGIQFVACMGVAILALGHQHVRARDYLRSDSGYYFQDA